MKELCHGDQEEARWVSRCQARPRPMCRPCPSAARSRSGSPHSPGHGGAAPGSGRTLSPRCSRSLRGWHTPGKLGRGLEPIPPVARRYPPAPSPAVPAVGLAGPGSPRLRPSWQRPWRRPPGTAPQRRLAVPRSRRPPLPVSAVSESMAALPARNRHGPAGTRAPPARAATWANFGRPRPLLKGPRRRREARAGPGQPGTGEIPPRTARTAGIPLPSGPGKAHGHLGTPPQLGELVVFRGSSVLCDHVLQGVLWTLSSPVSASPE